MATLEADLRRALVAGDLVLRYHPIIDLGSGRTVAVEALCRWRHWSRGLLGPADFLPLATETGLMVPVGSWVLEESCRRLGQWRAGLADADTLAVTVNLSAAELRDGGLVDRAARAVDAFALPAERLVVEVSEAAAYADPPEPAARNIEALAGLGVGVAIDGVGAPHPGNPAGLPDPSGWLWAMPIRLVKIDRGVAAGLEGSRAVRVLSGALRLAADRNAVAVVKGIETSEQLAQVYRLGYPAGQGFLFARPMDAADAEAYLRRGLRTVRSA